MVGVPEGIVARDTAKRPREWWGLAARPPSGQGEGNCHQDYHGNARCNLGGGQDLDVGGLVVVEPGSNSLPEDGPIRSADPRKVTCKVRPTV